MFIHSTLRQILMKMKKIKKSKPSKNYKRVYYYEIIKVANFLKKQYGKSQKKSELIRSFTGDVYKNRSLL